MEGDENSFIQVRPPLYPKLQEIKHRLSIILLKKVLKQLSAEYFGNFLSLPSKAQGLAIPRIRLLA
jgi:hypothetical protein